MTTSLYTKLFNLSLMMEEISKPNYDDDIIHGPNKIFYGLVVKYLVGGKYVSIFFSQMWPSCTHSIRSTWRSKQESSRRIKHNEEIFPCNLLYSRNKSLVFSFFLSFYTSFIMILERPLLHRSEI